MLIVLYTERFVSGLYISTKNRNFSVINFEYGNFSVADFINKKAFLKIIVHFLCFLLQSWTVNWMMIDYIYKRVEIIIFMRLGAKRSRSSPETEYHGTGLCSG